MNKVFLSGTVGALPVYHSPKEELGKGVSRFAIVHDDMWINVKTFFALHPSITSGSKVLVEGKLKAWQWNGKKGVDIVAEKVTMVEKSLNKENRHLKLIIDDSGSKMENAGSQYRTLHETIEQIHTKKE